MRPCGWSRKPCTKSPRNIVWKKGEEEIIYGSLRGLMNSLDPDSSFLTPQEYQQVLSGQKGPVAEAGVELIYKDNLLTVVSALDGGPAWRAGLRPGDHILKINGQLVRNLTTQEATRRFQGTAGNRSQSAGFAQRPGQTPGPERDPGTPGPGGVTKKILKETYAYIRIPYFTQDTPGELAGALKQLQRQRPPLRGIVLDLRNNARGSLELAVRAASPFLGDKEVVSTRGRPPEPTQTYQGRAREEVFKPGLPLVVLVDGGTARAAEALAGALRDQSQAVLLGAKTVGLCGLTKTLPLQDGSALVMTVAQCYTPNGQKIHGKGLEPEVQGQAPAAHAPGVTPPAKLPPEQDPWVAQALEILKTGKAPESRGKGGNPIMLPGRRWRRLMTARKKCWGAAVSVAGSGPLLGSVPGAARLPATADSQAPPLQMAALPDYISPAADAKLRVLAQALALVEEQYVEPKTPKDLIYGSIQGAVSTLDSHSSFMTPEEYRELQIETKGKFSGIGIEITLKDRILTVVSPIEGTPAYRAGIQAGDQIVKINGTLHQEHEPHRSGEDDPGRQRQQSDPDH